MTSCTSSIVLRTWYMMPSSIFIDDACQLFTPYIKGKQTETKLFTVVVLGSPVHAAGTTFINK